MIPKRVKIGGLNVEVKLVPTLELEDRMGESDFIKGIIRLDENMNEDLMWETFFHEVIHFINNELRHSDIQFLAHTFYQFLSENKLINKNPPQL